MKKWGICLALFSFLLLILVGCEGDSAILTRIDIQTSENDIILTDTDKLIAMENILKDVRWEENSKVEMARKEDMKLTFFYQFDENMPEKLEEYLVWLGESNSAEFIDLNKNGTYGRLDKEATVKLNKLLQDK
ncbi:hypothetical protein CU633_04605 [Bacillus sp. V3-13]|uniref:hypothetical protein n=1 Tax=Bacillus sp. V3-13 TaxID=2053728 RepID=UPI000C7933CC|nr:hypothetical protein [Bacillus sp. V3-13]PLR78513.1 hypothetical protein CU633_04605 [Bacillus sp. V3-13]